MDQLAQEGIGTLQEPWNIIRKIYSIVGHPFVMISIFAIALGCGGDDGLPPVDCSIEPMGFTEVAAFGACTGCHTSAREGTNRAGAPAGVDFDTYDAAVVNAERAAIRVYAGTMPPVGGISEPDKQALYAWALCGTPP